MFPSGIVSRVPSALEQLPRTLGELCARQAARTPHRIAVVDGDRTLTYAELNARANQLAHDLQARGVAAEVPVGICLERSIDQIVGILAILKAGGAGVPMGTTYPVDRLEYMRADSGTTIVMTRSNLRHLFPARAAQVLAIDELDAALDRESPLDPITAADPAQLAYVIYTSGSTGRPKGVLLEHRNIINSLRGLQARFPVAAGDGYLFKAHPTFDISLLEVFGPMWEGGRIVILPPGDEQDPLAIVNAMTQHQVTHAVFVASTIQMVLDVCPAAHAVLRRMKYLLVGGEAVSRRLAARLRALSGRVRVANAYGPTETAIICTAFVLDEDIDAPTAPIGTPIANLTAHLLDEHRRPVVPGVCGELYIGGDSVGRGYLNAPDLTRERFIDDPFVPGGRLYKTGDLCRRIADGLLEFVERVDRQVKIRGYRVELGEIESCLKSHSQVGDAVVTAPAGANGDVRLAAYYVVRDRGTACSPEDLRAHLDDFLPGYMIPTSWRRMDALPVNENGKIDRRALPPIEVARTNVGDMAKGNTLADTIATLWAAELGGAEIGPDDDFFSLGGHSLSAARVVAALRTTLRKDVSVSDLYLAPTIRDFTRVLADAPAIAGSPATGAIDARANMPLSYEQFGFWLLAKGGASNLNVFGRRRINGRLDRDALTVALDRVIDCHPALRCRLGRWVPRQRVEAHCVAAIEGRDLAALNDSAQEAAALASMDELSRVSAWPSGTPLVRVRLLLLRPDLSELQVCMPHIVSDEASVTIVFEDLSRHYLDVLEGRLPTTDDEENALATLVAEERAALHGRLGQHVRFWERYCEDASRIVFPESAVVPADMRTESVYLEVSSEHVEAIRQAGRVHGLGVAELLYAAALCTVAPYVECSDRGGRQAVLLAPRSVREVAAYDRAVGLFARMDLLKADLNGSPTLVNLARRVRQASIDTALHQHCPLAVKSASLHQRRWRARDHWCRLLARLAVAMTPAGTIDYDVALANARVAALQWSPAPDFALIVNVLNSFVVPGSDHLFGQPLACLSTHPTYEPPVRRVLEMYFLREPNAANGYLLMLNGDLTTAFRRQLGRTLIGALEALHVAA